MNRTRPNIVFIMPDQLRHDFLSCYGASFIDTPHIDALAADGVRFDQCYSEHPVCVAARASLITGMNAIKTGTLHNGQFVRPDYQACGISTWPELLNEQGYCTVAIGKMHFYPWEASMGFQHRVIAEENAGGSFRTIIIIFLLKTGIKRLITRLNRSTTATSERSSTLIHGTVPSTTGPARSRCAGSRSTTATHPLR